MTLYAPADVRDDWRINYGITKLESAQSAFEFWQRRGGVLPGCVLALAHAIEQIDADEELMKQALEALEKADRISGYPNNKKVVLALQERLK